MIFFTQILLNFNFLNHIFINNNKKNKKIVRIIVNNICKINNKNTKLVYISNTELSEELHVLIR